VAAAERRKVGPIVGVGALGGRRVVRRREVVLNGSRELGEDGSPALERLDRSQVVANHSHPTRDDLVLRTLEIKETRLESR